MSDRLDPYAVLGVARTASLPEIRKAWRLIAKESHPDRNPGDAAAEARFKDAAAAWAILSDPAARARWDRGPRVGPRRPDPNLDALERYARKVREATEDVAHILFDAVLPAYLERFERGLGAEVTWRMLDDIDNLRMLDLPQEVGRPGFAARQRAAALRARLRIRLDLRTRHTLDGEPRIAELTLVQDRELRWAALTVWVGSLLARDLDDLDDLRVALLPALAVEVVRAMEADLPADLRVLAWRDRTGNDGFPHTLAQARRRDARTVALQGARIALGVIGVVVAVWVLLWVWRGAIPWP